MDPHVRDLRPSQAPHPGHRAWSDGRLVGRSIGRTGERTRYVVIAELRPVENRDDKPQDGGVLGKLSHKSLKELNAAAVKRRRLPKELEAAAVNAAETRNAPRDQIKS